MGLKRLTVFVDWVGDRAVKDLTDEFAPEKYMTADNIVRLLRAAGHDARMMRGPLDSWARPESRNELAMGHSPDVMLLVATRCGSADDNKRVEGVGLTYCNPAMGELAYDIGEAMKDLHIPFFTCMPTDIYPVCVPGTRDLPPRCIIIDIGDDIAKVIKPNPHHIDIAVLAGLTTYVNKLRED